MKIGHTAFSRESTLILNYDDGMFTLHILKFHNRTSSSLLSDRVTVTHFRFRPPLISLVRVECVRYQECSGSGESKVAGRMR